MHRNPVNTKIPTEITQLSNFNLNILCAFPIKATLTYKYKKIYIFFPQNKLFVPQLKILNMEA